MAKLRHIAIATNDPKATAEFYKKAFGFEQIGETSPTSPLAQGYFLSDGTLNIAEEIAGGQRAARAGLPDLLEAERLLVEFRGRFRIVGRNRDVSQLLHDRHPAGYEMVAD